MDEKRPVKYGIGWIILDCILLLSTLNDIRTGKMTWETLFAIIVLSMILAVILVASIKKYRKKKREQSHSAKTEEP